MTDFATPQAHALLIGTGHYQASDLTDVDSVAATLAAVKDVLISRCGLRADRIEVLEDPSDVHQTNERVRAATRKAGPLIIYFVGHALLEPRTADLFLALSGTQLQDLGATALAYATIADEVRDERRSQVTLILVDGCFAGRATADPGRAADVGFARSGIQGAYVIASSADDTASWADADGTVFSKALVELLRDGDPRRRARFSLEEVYAALHDRLRRGGKPVPQQHSVNAVGHLVLAPNVGYPWPEEELPEPGEPAPGVDGTECPYPGLRPFDPAEHGRFFGRTRADSADRSERRIETTEDLVDAVRERWSRSGPHLLSGPSGVGKSSLVAAGLLPALDAGALELPESDSCQQWFMAPGTSPLTELAKAWRAQRETRGVAQVTTAQMRTDLLKEPTAAADLLARPGRDNEQAQPLVLVVDQFEEIFAPEIPAAEREAFIAALVAAARMPDGQRRPAMFVLLVLSADRLGSCMEHPDLRQALDDLLVVEPVTTDALREIITGPARLAGLGIGAGLIAAITAEAEAGTALGRTGTVAPGALPHLANALFRTWETCAPDKREGDRRGFVLTVECYEATGGIRGALGKSATDTYRNLTPGQQPLAKRLFLDLVGITEGVGATNPARRRVRRTELDHPGDPAGALDDVIKAFAAQRLLTRGGDQGGETVEIAHEALIESWQELRDWIEDDRGWIELRDRLDHDADRWEADHDGTGLYGGRRLGAVEDDMARHGRNPDDLQPAARQFLAVSRRHRTRNRAVVAAVAAFLVALTIATSVLSLVNSRRRTEALSKALAAEATQVIAKDSALGRQLAVASHRYAPTVDALSSVLASQTAPDITRLADHPKQSFASAATADGRLLATAGAEGHVRLWDTTDPDDLRLRADLAVPEGGGAVFSIALSPDGSLLAAGDEAGQTLLWRLNGTRAPEPQRLPTVEATGLVLALAFNSTGQRLASGSAGGALLVFEIDEGAAGTVRGSAPYGRRLRTEVQALAFHPGSNILVAADGAGAISRWRAGDRSLSNLGTVKRFNLSAAAVAFSPDGRLLAAASSDHTIILWTVDPANGELSAARPLDGSEDAVFDLSFSHDGKTLISAGNGGKVMLWSTGTSRPVLVLPQAMPVHGAEFLADRSSVATVGQDGILRVWHLPGRDVVADPEGPVSSALASDGRLAATGGLNGVVRLWTVGADGGVTPTALLSKIYGPVQNMAFSPTKALLVVPSEDGRIDLWDVSRPGDPKLITALPGVRPQVLGVAFSPDGTLLAVVGRDDEPPANGLAGTVRLYNIGRPAAPELIDKAQDRRGAALTASFSADGGLLAVGGGDSRVNLYKVGPAGLTAASHLDSGSQYINAVRFAPGGRLLAFAGEQGRVRLADVTQPDHPVMRRGDLPTYGSIILGLAWLGVDQFVAVDNNGTTWLWHADDLTLRARMTTHEGAVYAVTADRTGRSFATAGQDGHLQVLDVDPGSVITRICDGVGMPMSDDEWRRFEPDVDRPVIC